MSLIKLMSLHIHLFKKENGREAGERRENEVSTGEYLYYLGT